MDTTKLKVPVVTQEVKDEALEILRQMGYLARKDKIKRVGYINEADFGNAEPVKEVPLCNGFNMCAIGSLWISAGVKPRKDKWGDWGLPGADEDTRSSFINRRPPLKLAYIYLNRVAREYMEKEIPEFEPNDCFDAEIEALFESDSSDRDKIVNGELLDKLIKRARGRIKNLEVAA